MRYRRAKVAGGTYFFTVNLAERQLALLTEHVKGLREAVSAVKRRHAFRIDAMVILPDHLHAIWTLPEGDSDFPARWALVKAAFSRTIPAPKGGAAVAATRGNEASGSGATGSTKFATRGITPGTSSTYTTIQ
jgi:putative transposase